MMSEIIRNLLQLKKLTKSKVNKYYTGKKSRDAMSAKGILEATKEPKQSKKFDTLKKGVKQNHNT